MCLFSQMLLRYPENLKPQNQSLTPFPVFFEGKSGEFVIRNIILRRRHLKCFVEVWESTFEIERRRLFNTASRILHFWCLGIQIEQS